MSTTSSDNFKRNYDERVRLPLDPSNHVNQGDMVYADKPGNSMVALDDDDSHAALFAGVSEHTSPTPVTFTHLEDIVVIPRGEFEFKTKVGDVYNNFDKVYCGADAQTVTNDNGGTTPTRTKEVGYVKLDQGVSSLTGAAGVKVRVLIRPQWEVLKI